MWVLYKLNSFGFYTLSRACLLTMRESNSKLNHDGVMAREACFGTVYLRISIRYYNHEGMFSRSKFIGQAGLK